MADRRFAVASAGALLAALAGCSVVDSSSPPGPTASPPEDGVVVEVRPEPWQPADAAQVRAAGEPLGLGEVVAVGLPPGVPAPVDGVRTVAVTADPLLASAPEEDDGVVPDQDLLVLAAPEGGTFEVLADGTLLLRDAGGLVRAAADRPRGPAGTSARWEPVTADVVALRTGGPGAAGVAPGLDAVVVEVTIAEHALASADWGEREGGRSVAVVPADWARRGGFAALDLLWAELVAAAPEADLPTVRAQLDCHALGAPDKDAWNLEPWRPDVDALAMIATACNPE